MARGAVIIGTGSYVGDEVLSRETILQRCKLDPDAIEDPGIQEQFDDAYPVRRRFSDPRRSTSDLLIEAGRNALRKSGITPDEINLLICVTDTPDFISPATAARVQHELKAIHAGFLDLNSACAGFPMALSLAAAQIQSSSSIQHVLIIGGNLYSKFLHPTDLFSQLLFSDGAGAVVLAASEREDPGIRQSAMYGDGQYWSNCGLFAGGTWKGFSQEALKEGYQSLRMLRPYEVGMNIEKWPPLIHRVLKKTGWTPGDIDRAFLTQSSSKTIRSICDQFGWAYSISHDTGPKYGYLGSACIPVALDDAIENGTLTEGAKLLILASGIGYSCCAVTLVWGAA